MIIILARFYLFTHFQERKKYTKNKKKFLTYQLYPVFGMLAETRLFLFYALVLNKTYVMVTPKNHHDKAISMDTNN